MAKDVKQMLRELVEEVLKEMSTTGGVAGYQTPNAFAGKGDAARKRKLAADSMPGGKVVRDIDEMDEKVTADVEVEEPSMVIRRLREGRSRYRNFRESSVMKNHSKVSYGIREVKKTLTEVEFLIGLCERLKLETNVDQSHLWKRSKQDIAEIHGRLKNIARKVNRVSK